MTTEEKINQLEAAFKAQIDELRKEVKPKFEVGKWYKVDGTPFMKYLNKYHTVDSNFGYGINLHGEWTNSEFGLDSATPATDKEVEEALIKEAERRYSKAKGYITSGRSWIVNEFHRYKYIEGALRLYADVICVGSGNRFENGFNEVFRDGKWAEIIKDEPIKVGGYTVEKHGGYVKIGCKKIADTSVGSLNIIMKSYNFKKVAFDGIEVDLETIEKILKL